MKDVTFYLEHESPKHKRRNEHSGNVFAAWSRPYHDGCQAVREGLGSLFDRPDSPVCTTAASLDVIRKCYKRIPEAKAREIHPALFQVLDAPDD